MKLNRSPRIGSQDVNLLRELRDHAMQVNDLAEGRLTAAYTAATSAPTTGSNAQGDVVRNSAPTELGSAPNQYVITGWICVAGGSPGTFRQMRVLTGN
jgi:hypothetical protein